jgi:hypothetical protein
MHMAKYGMTFAVSNSKAQNVFRRVRMMFQPGSDRLIVTPKDGFHCKGNRVGLLIEECCFEGLLDDSINISVCPYWIKKVIAPGRYALSGRPAIGDRLTAFTPKSGAMDEGLVVKSVQPYAPKPKRFEVELDRAIPNPVVNDTGDDFPGGIEKMKFTGLYNADACGADYIVRNCTFCEQRRHALLVRAPGGLIEGNTIDGVGGNGVHMANEVGSFYEGPVPENCIIGVLCVPEHAKGADPCRFQAGIESRRLRKEHPHHRQPHRKPFRALHSGFFRERTDGFQQQICGYFLSLWCR